MREKKKYIYYIEEDNVAHTEKLEFSKKKHNTLYKFGDFRKIGKFFWENWKNELTLSRKTLFKNFFILMNFLKKCTVSEIFNLFIKK